jgi:glycosyltransferase involved in cell wall biosynthesis
MARSTLAVVILARDEQRHIAACIASIGDQIDPIVVWDSGSRDATLSLALRAGAHVVYRPFDNYAAQRQAALNTIDAEWILFVDADERVTPALKAEVRAAIDTGIHAGYWIPRRNFIVGREIRNGGYAPDYQLRLLRRKTAQYVPEREVHELVDVSGSVGHLTEPLFHFNYDSWAQFHEKQRVYVRYEAEMMAEWRGRSRPHHIALQPLREFWRRYVALSGWRDGIRGFQLALMLAWYYGFMANWLLRHRP